MGRTCPLARATLYRERQTGGGNPATRERTTLPLAPSRISGKPCACLAQRFLLALFGYSPGNVSRGAWHGYYDTGLLLPDGNTFFCDSNVGTTPCIVSKLMREVNEEYGDLEISFKMVTWLCCGIAEGDRYIVSITNLFETRLIVLSS